MESMVVSAAFWRDKRVFLTGHSGFKGSWLSLWLYQLGAKVTGFSLEPPTDPSLFVEAKIEKLLRAHIIGDIRDEKSLAQAMQYAEPDIVIHMAAQPLVRDSYNDPVTTYATNVMGTVHLFEAARKTPSVKAILNITTDKCYENNEWLWGYRENEPMGGRDPYSSSKGCAELVSSAYRSSFLSKSGIALATARAGNVIGGGDWAVDRIVPDAMRAFMQIQPLQVRNPNAVRPWQHVLEPLAGYLALGQKLFEQGQQFSEGWNFGPNEVDAKPVSYLADVMSNAWGEEASWQFDVGEHPHEANYLKLDCTKAKMLLNWCPQWELSTALQQTVAWYKAWHRGSDMYQFSLQQIIAYGVGNHQ
jgi:CDP-glucose 4,6-dehydratase